MKLVDASKELAVILEAGEIAVDAYYCLQARYDTAKSEYMRMLDQRNDAESEEARVKELLFEGKSSTYDVHFYGIEPIRVRAMTVSTAIIIAKTYTDVGRPFQYALIVI